MNNMRSYQNNQPQVVMGNRLLLKQLHKENDSKQTIITLICSLVLIYGSFTTIFYINDVLAPYLNIGNMLTYEFVEREGDCNIFVNGFNEYRKICPSHIEDYNQLKQESIAAAERLSI